MTKTFSPFYISYMNGPEWAKRKEIYYRTHKRQCKACGATRNVQLHHLTYARLGREHNRDLMPLCGNKCHPRVDTFRKFGFKRKTATWLVVVVGRLFRF